jgi:hypothetical protein
MSQLKDERRMKEIFDRGAPYPWDFWESSESEFAGQDYETYWDEIPPQTEARTTRNYW